MTVRNHAAPLSWRLALLDILILGTLLTITLLLGTTIPHPPHVLRLTIDQPSVVLRLAGMYPVERFAVGSQVFRWTRAQSQVSLPVPGDPAILQITLLGHPDEPTYARLKLGALDELITIQPTLRRYSFLLSPVRGERVSMLIEAPVATIAGRDLGVAVSDAVLVSRRASMPVLVLIALAIAMIGSYSLAVQARAPRWMAAGGVLVLAVLALLWHWQWGWRRRGRMGRCIPGSNLGLPS